MTAEKWLSHSPQVEKLKLQNSFLEKQLARRISVIDEVKRENEALLKDKQIAEIQTQDLASEVKQLTERVEDALERERSVTFEKHKAEDLLHKQSKKVAELEVKAEELEKEKAELSIQVGSVDVRYEEMQSEYRKLRARLEKHELLTELSVSKEQALLLTELTKTMSQATVDGMAPASAATKDGGGDAVPAAKPVDKVGGKTAWSELDSALETQLRHQVKTAGESMHDAHRRLALKHVKNEALVAQLRAAEKKVRTPRAPPMLCGSQTLCGSQKLLGAIGRIDGVAWRCPLYVCVRVCTNCRSSNWTETSRKASGWSRQRSAALRSASTQRANWWRS